MMLESFKHEHCSFVTLTYSDDHLPEGGTLVPKHTQDWLKRLRFELAPRKLRYFLVGEYGDQSWRPHYHAALFGVGLDDAEVVDRTWGLGYTYTGDLNSKSAMYVTGYVSKKMTSKDDDRCIYNGIHPEFARMSRKPGIGAVAVDDIVDTLCSQFGINSLTNNRDVPVALSEGKKSLLLGRYLRSKIREKIAGPKAIEEIKSENKLKYALEMWGLLDDRCGVADAQGKRQVSKSVYQVVKEVNEGKIKLLEDRTKIFSRRGSL